MSFSPTKTIPYFLIFITLVGFYFFPKFFVNSSFDQYYGKYINQKAYNFSLTSSQNQTIKLEQFRDKFVLLTFGFTKCDSICPVNLTRFHQLWRRAKEDHKELVFIFISIDNIRDDKKEITQFLKHFNLTNLYGLTDGKDTTLKVAKKYHNHIILKKEQIKKNANWQINHNGFIYLIDKKGNLATIYMQKEIKLEQIYKDIKKLALR